MRILHSTSKHRPALQNGELGVARTVPNRRAALAYLSSDGSTSMVRGAKIACDMDNRTGEFSLSLWLPENAVMSRRDPA